MTEKQIGQVLRFGRTGAILSHKPDMSHFSGRDEDADGSTASGPKCCYTLKTGEERTGLGRWLWNMTLEVE